MADPHIDADTVLTTFLSWDDLARQVTSGRATLSSLRRALKHPNIEVRCRAAQGLSHDADAMAMAARDTHQSVRCVAARSPVTPPDALARMARDRALFVRQLLATRDDLDQATYLELAFDQNITVRANVAAGRRPVEVLQFLLHDLQPDVQHSLMANPHLPESLATYAAQISDEQQRAVLCRHTTWPSVLDTLSNDRAAAVRRAAIDNPLTTGPMLVRLVDDDPSLRRRVLETRRRSLPREAVRRYVLHLLASPDTATRRWVRKELSAHVDRVDVTEPPAVTDHRRLFEVVDRWLPYELIAHALDDAAVPSAVRAALLAHPDVPLSTLARSAANRSPVLRQAAEQQLYSVLNRSHRAFRVPRSHP